MLARRLIIALVVSAAVSGAFTLWLGRHVRNTRAASSSAQLLYVATSAKLGAGETLTTSNVQLISWPSNVPLEGAFAHPADVVGRTLLYPLASGEPILERQIAAPGTGAGLSPHIPAGMRALSLKSDQIVGVAGYLLPGTHVDVLVTLHGSSTSDSITSTVLQDAEILTAGQKMQPDPDGKATPVDVVTLLVTPQDAEKAVLASSQGTVHFVLRNGTDHARVDDAPTHMSSLSGEMAAKPVAHVGAKEPVPAMKHYSVEVLRGDKQTVETFQ